MYRAPMRTRLAVLLALASASLAACGDAERPPTFEYIHTAIIEPNCTTASCHSELAQVSGLDFTSLDTTYSELTGRECENDDAPARGFVNPGQPENSQLMFLLLDIEVPRPMPPDVQLPEADIDLIEQWILEGAPCN